MKPSIPSQSKTISENSPSASPHPELARRAAKAERSPRELVSRKSLLGMAFCAPFIVLLLLLMAGCQGFQGKQIPQSSQIDLEKDRQGTGHLSAKNLSLTYQYETRSGTLDISGQGRIHRDGLSYFHLDLYFVDSDNKVMATSALASASVGGPFSFREQKSIPAGAQGFALGYSGEYVAKEVGSVSFWHYPFGGN